MEASKLYIKAKDMQAAVASLQRARNLYVQHGKISQAARACKELATALKENGDKDSTLLALESYMEAARMYETDSSYSEMVRTAALMLAVAHYAVQLCTLMGGSIARAACLHSTCIAAEYLKPLAFC